MALLLIFVLLVGIFFYILISSSQEKGTQSNFLIQQGEGVNEISRALYDANLIRSKFVFETYVWLLRGEGKIVAGEYDLSKNFNIINITSRLFRGPEKPRDRSITIIEGWSRRDIAEYLEKEGLVSGAEFLEKTKELEGYLFPDTYRVFRDVNTEEIIEKMLDNFHKKMNEELLSEIKNQGKTIEEILTIASIIEAEVRTNKDRKEVADIFWKRLKIGMPLQSDATINFVTQSRRSRSSLEDLQVDSPYNTYKYAGLPPGPINNPSLDAILAAIFPTSNVYYYFLTDKEGKVYYARNLDEHNLNRVKYLP